MSMLVSKKTSPCQHKQASINSSVASYQLIYSELKIILLEKNCVHTDTTLNYKPTKDQHSTNVSHVSYIKLLILATHV